MSGNLGRKTQKMGARIAFSNFHNWRPTSGQVIRGIARTLARQPVDAGYSLEDMAADMVGLLDELKLSRVHVAGISLGGMIAQVLACRAPNRVLSLTSISSAVGNPKTGFGRFVAIMAIIALGVGFLIGIMQATPDMKNSMDGYLRDSAAYDIGVKGAYGLSEEDIAAIEGAKDADGNAVARGIARTRVAGRLEHVASVRGAEVFVDFAHTPDGLVKSLSALREHCAGRLFVLFGCGGERDAGKRAEMGRAAAQNADVSVLTSDNPRREDPCAILSMIERGFAGVSSEYVVIEERERAIGYALGELGEGDILLIAGKGAENYQEIMGIKYPFSDQAVVRDLLKK